MSSERIQTPGVLAEDDLDRSLRPRRLDEFVGQARGVVMAAAGERGVACAGYTPQQVKGAVCGTGRADKDQVGRMVQALLSLPAPPAPDHAADALAVAICHANHAPLAMAVAG